MPGVIHKYRELFQRVIDSYQRKAQADAAVDETTSDADRQAAVDQLLQAAKDHRSARVAWFEFLNDTAQVDRQVAANASTYLNA